LPVISVICARITGITQRQTEWRDSVWADGDSVPREVHGELGDGTSNVYYTSGGDYPNKSISHSWTTAGTYDINVVADWTAQWSLGGTGGTVTGFRTTGSIPQFRVYEAQTMQIG
jgi:hypothetical protein